MATKEGIEKVICIKEVPTRPIFVKGNQYEAHPVSRGGQGLTTWVGISGTGGHDFHESDLIEHFRRV